MNFFDPLRPRQTNGTPCWSEAPHTALPTVNLEPLEGDESGADLWIARVMVYDDVKGGCWVETHIPLSEIDAFLEAWKEGPEAALWNWFSAEAPKARARARQPAESIVSDPIVSETSMEDLGL